VTAPDPMTPADEGMKESSRHGASGPVTPDSSAGLEVVAAALASARYEVTIDDYDRERAAETPGDWCVECLPPGAAALNAARIAMEALQSSGFSVMRADALAEARAQERARIADAIARLPRCRPVNTAAWDAIDLDDAIRAAQGETP
jgi:nicotinate-nucleotide pyrophosphorylase